MKWLMYACLFTAGLCIVAIGWSLSLGHYGVAAYQACLCAINLFIARLNRDMVRGQ